MLSTNIGQALNMQMKTNATFTLLQVTHKYSLTWIISIHVKDKIIKLVHADKRKAFVKSGRIFRTHKASTIKENW